jgi:hypothetical protein
MATYTVKVRRTEAYTATVDVEAADHSEARTQVQNVLDSEGWDGVFPCGDGEYDECHSEVLWCMNKDEGQLNDEQSY